MKMDSIGPFLAKQITKKVETLKAVETLMSDSLKNSEDSDIYKEMIEEKLQKARNELKSFESEIRAREDLLNVDTESNNIVRIPDARHMKIHSKFTELSSVLAISSAPGTKIEERHKASKKGIAIVQEIDNILTGYKPEPEIFKPMYRE